MNRRYGPILYPLAIYSPELQAIHWAHEHQTECRFMDLPSGAMLALGEAVADEADPAESTEWVYRRMEQLTGEEHDTFWERNLSRLRTGRIFRRPSICLENSCAKRPGTGSTARPRPWFGKPI